MKIIIVIFLIVMNFAYVNAEEVNFKPIATWRTFEHTLYKGFSGEDITVAWSDNSEWCSLAVFDIYAIHEETGQLIIIKENIARNIFEYTFTLPRTGHWIPKIRVKQACSAEEDERGLCTEGEYWQISEWCNSTDPLCTKPDEATESRGWWIFTWVAPPGPLLLMESMIGPGNN